MRAQQFKLLMRILIVIARGILNNSSVTDSAGILYSQVSEIVDEIE